MLKTNLFRASPDYAQTKLSVHYNRSVIRGWTVWTARWIYSVSVNALLLTPVVLAAQSTLSNPVQQHIEKAEQALRASDKATAQREYNEILKLDPQNAQAWTGLGILLYGLG